MVLNVHSSIQRRHVTLPCCLREMHGHQGADKNNCHICIFSSCQAAGSTRLGSAEKRAPVQAGAGPRSAARLCLFRLQRATSSSSYLSVLHPWGLLCQPAPHLSLHVPFALMHLPSKQLTARRGICLDLVVQP